MPLILQKICPKHGNNLLTLSMRHAVLASNFAGSTSALLSLDGGAFASRIRADALFPVAGYKRCLDTQAGYGAGHAWQQCAAAQGIACMQPSG